MNRRLDLCPFACLQHRPKLVPPIADEGAQPAMSATGGSRHAITEQWVSFAEWAQGISP
jgi:hypothetical protein